MITSVRRSIRNVYETWQNHQNDQAISAVPDRALHRLDGRCLFDQGRAGNISGSVGAVFGIAGQRSALLRRLAECTQRNPDRGTGCPASAQMQTRWDRHSNGIGVCLRLSDKFLLLFDPRYNCAKLSGATALSCGQLFCACVRDLAPVQGRRRHAPRWSNEPRDQSGHRQTLWEYQDHLWRRVYRFVSSHLSCISRGTQGRERGQYHSCHSGRIDHKAVQ